MKTNSVLLLMMLLGFMACDHDQKNTQQVKKTIVPGFKFSAVNSSDSTIYVDYMGFNNQYSLRPSRFQKCAFGVNFSGGGGVYTNIPPPTSIEATWEHELTGSYYTVSIPLHQDLAKWLLDSSTLPIQRSMAPGEYPDKYPSITITFWENYHVEAWLVLYDDQPTDQTAIKLGEAVGQQYQPEFKVHVSGVSYKDMAGDIGAMLLPGQDLRYNREFDQELTRTERYGCFHDENYLYIKEKEPLRYGLLVGLKGELINCKTDDCSDNPNRNKWRDMVQENKLKISSYTKDNPTPLRVHPKPSPEEFERYVNKQINYRKRDLARKKKSWVCLNPPEPCFKGFYKYYPTKIITQTTSIPQTTVVAEPKTGEQL
ncbi:MAG: hypothetical protein ACC657_14660 [Thiohalomonadales bacterium]